MCCPFCQVRIEEEEGVEPAYPSDKIRLGRLSFKGASPRMKKVRGLWVDMSGLVWFDSTSLSNMSASLQFHFQFLHRYTVCEFTDL